MRSGPDGEPIVTTLTDFGDLHTFNIAFDQSIGVDSTKSVPLDVDQRRSLLDLRGRVAYVPIRIESPPSTADQRLATDRHRSRSPQVRRGTGSNDYSSPCPARSRFVPDYSKYAQIGKERASACSMAIRISACSTAFGFDADGGILGRTYSDTARSTIGSPVHRLGSSPTSRSDRSDFYGHAWASIGFNDGDMQQRTAIGAELVPGAVNRLLYAQPTQSEHQRLASTSFPPPAYCGRRLDFAVTERSPCAHYLVGECTSTTS